MQAVQKRKAGRPTKAEVAARGITKTDLETGMRILKKIYGSAIEEMIRISDGEDISDKERFKMKQELVMMYVNLIKSDQVLKMQLTKSPEAPEDPQDKPLAPIFNFAK